MQYAAILQEMVDPLSVFDKQQRIEAKEGRSQKFNEGVVGRDRSLSNRDLLQRYAELVGNNILDRLI